jgi:hypothetical protein
LTPAQSSQAACLDACPADEPSCRAKCIVINPGDYAQQNSTIDCISSCEKGNGTATDNLNYENCQKACVAEATVTPTPIRDTATAVTRNTATATRSGSTATGTGSSDDSEGSGSSSDSEGSGSDDKTSSASGGDSSSQTGSSASSTSSGSAADNVRVGAMGAFIGFGSLAIVFGL